MEFIVTREQLTAPGAMRACAPGLAAFDARAVEQGHPGHVVYTLELLSVIEPRFRSYLEKRRLIPRARKIARMAKRAGEPAKAEKPAKEKKPRAPRKPRAPKASPVPGGDTSKPASDTPPETDRNPATLGDVEGAGV